MPVPIKADIRNLEPQWREKGAERDEALAAVSDCLAETTLGRHGSDRHRRFSGAHSGPDFHPDGPPDGEEPLPVFAADLPPSSAASADVSLGGALPAPAGPISSSP